MNRSSLPYRAIQQLARLCAAVLLVTICAGSVVVLSGHHAQAGQPDSDSAALPSPSAGIQTSPAQPAAPEGQPVQADIPETAREAASPAPVPEETPASENQASPAQGALPASQPVDGDWFADAAFVGDSRTEGLLLYSGLKAGGGFAYRGLTVQSARTDRVFSVKGQQMTAVEALSQGSYGKVYLMLGVNELGWYNDKRYEDNYAQLIDLVKQAQPGAQIYLQTLIPVSAEKSASSYVNNPQILVYNEIITRLVQEKGAYLVDVWSEFVEEDGALNPEGSVDGVHLTKQYYVRWLDYLKTHTAQ